VIARPPASHDDLLCSGSSPGPPPVSAASAKHSVRRAGVVAGIGLLLMAPLAAFGNVGVLGRLVTKGDAATTAKAIEDSQSLFVLGILSLSVVAVLDVIVALALMRFFSPVNQRLSTIAAGMRVAYAGIFAVAIGELGRVLQVLGDSDQMLLRINAFTDIWDAALTLFGLYLLLLGYLACRASYVPTWLGGILAIAGLGYLFDSVAARLSPGLTWKVASVTGLGEVALIFWLLWTRRGLDLNRSHRWRASRGPSW